MAAPENCTILLVDDEQDIRTVARLSLRQLGGFTVLEAASGARALELLSQTAVDAVILDVMMPDMDGPDVLRALRANPRTASLPVIFLTAKAMPSELERLRSLGAWMIVTKPFDPSVLVSRVRQALAARPDAHPEPEAKTRPTVVHDASRTVDADALRKLRGLISETGAPLALELIEVFAANVREVLPVLRGLTGGQPTDFRELERLAHGLKGSAATLGATAITELARTIETRAAEQRTEDITSRIDSIAEQLDQTIEQLRGVQARLDRDA